MIGVNSKLVFSFSLHSHCFPFGKEHIYWKKWVDLTLDPILQDQSPDLSPAPGQDQDHILEKRDTGKLIPCCIESLFTVLAFVWKLIFACMMLRQK